MPTIPLQDSFCHGPKPRTSGYNPHCSMVSVLANPRLFPQPRPGPMFSNRHCPDSLPMPTGPIPNPSRRSPPTPSPPALASRSQTAKSEPNMTRFAQFPVKFMQKSAPNRRFRADSGFLSAIQIDIERQSRSPPPQQCPDHANGLHFTPLCQPGFGPVALHRQRSACSPSPQRQPSHLARLPAGS